MFCRNLNALLVTKKRKQWLTSLASAQLTHKSGQTTSIHTTKIPLKYHSNTTQIPLKYHSNTTQIPLKYHSNTTQIPLKYRRNM